MKTIPLLCLYTSYLYVLSVATVIFTVLDSITVLGSALPKAAVFYLPKLVKKEV